MIISNVSARLLQVAKEYKRTIILNVLAIIAIVGIVLAMYNPSVASTLSSLSSTTKGKAILAAAGTLAIGTLVWIFKPFGQKLLHHKSNTEISPVRTPASVTKILPHQEALEEFKNLSPDDIKLLNEMTFIYKFVMDPSYTWNEETATLAQEWDLGFENGGGVVVWLDKDEDQKFFISFQKTYPQFPLSFDSHGKLRFANTDIHLLLAGREKNSMSRNAEYLQIPGYMEAARYLVAYLFMKRKNDIMSGLEMYKGLSEEQAI